MTCIPALAAILAIQSERTCSLRIQPLSEAHPFGALRASSRPLLDRIDIHIEVPHSPH
jgi:hypothetical protein